MIFIFIVALACLANQWVAQAEILHQFGSSGEDHVKNVAFDSTGSFLVAAYDSTGAYIRKFSPTGVQSLSVQIPGIITVNDIAIASNDAFVIVGGIYGALPGKTSSGMTDAFLAKYDSDGNVMFMDQFGTHVNDLANSVAVDSNDNIIVEITTTGSLDNLENLGSNDPYFRYYDINGLVVFTKNFGSSHQDYSNAITFDRDGNIITSGYSFGQYIANQPYAGYMVGFVQKYNCEGSLIFQYQFGSGSGEYVFNVVTDNSNNIILVGYTYGDLDGRIGYVDGFIRKYNPDGEVLFTKQFGSPADDYALNVAVDSENNIIVAGHTAGSVVEGQANAGNKDAFVSFFDSHGNLIYSKQFGTAAYDYFYGVAARGSDVVAVGSTTGTLVSGENVGLEDGIMYIDTINMPTAEPTFAPTLEPGAANDDRHDDRHDDGDSTSSSDPETSEEEVALLVTFLGAFPIAAIGGYVAYAFFTSPVTSSTFNLFGKEVSKAIFSNKYSQVAVTTGDVEVPTTLAS